MSKPGDDLSALFRSLRPDESALVEPAGSGARDAQQRWPLFKAVAPKKLQDAPTLTEQERQRWTSQEKPAVGARKPALSLPGLSDKMSKGLGKMAGQAVKNTAAVKPATRRDSEKDVAQAVEEHPVERLQAAPLTSVLKANPRPTTVNTVAKPVSAAPAVNDRSSPSVSGQKSPVALPVSVSVSVPVSMMAQRNLPDAGRGDNSLKTLFSRLEAKPEVSVKPAVKRSSFLDRLGRR